MGRAILTEQNCMALKYLKWYDDLSHHPDFINAIKDASKFGLNRMVQRKHPCLSFMGLHESVDESTHLLLQGFFPMWKRISETSKGKIDIVSKPFLDGLNLSFKSLFTDSIVNDVLGQRFSGVTFLPDGAGGHTCFIYDFTCGSTEALMGKDTKYFIVLGRHSDIGMAFGRVRGRGCAYVSKGFAAEHIASFGEDVNNQEDFNKVLLSVVRHCVSTIVGYHIFKRYAKIEVKDAKMLDQKDTDQPIVKTTIKDVNYIDCSWFTTIVRSEGFKVRGHFRLQPYKNEQHEWDKKLIYISPFEKHGYTRRAKKLLELPQTEESL